MRESRFFGRVKAIGNDYPGEMCISPSELSPVCLPRLWICRTSAKTPPPPLTPAFSLLFHETGTFVLARAGVRENRQVEFKLCVFACSRENHRGRSRGSPPREIHSTRTETETAGRREGRRRRRRRSASEGRVTRDGLYVTPGVKCHFDDCQQ